MPLRSLRSRRSLDWPAFLAVLLVLIGLFEPAWAVAGPCCAAGEEGECCCVAEHEPGTDPVRPCCAGREDPSKPSPCDLPGGCTCSAVLQAPTPLFVVPPALDEGGRRALVREGLTTLWTQAGLQAGGWVAPTSAERNRVPPGVGPGDPPRPRGALHRGLLARLAELSIARI